MCRSMRQQTAHLTVVALFEMLVVTFTGLEVAPLVVDGVVAFMTAAAPFVPVEPG